jgi:hypothetical protein
MSEQAIQFLAFAIIFVVVAPVVLGLSHYRSRL